MWKTISCYMSAAPSDDRSSEFLAHMLKSQRAVRNYLYSLHPRPQDLDDLVQETALKLWREFEHFDTNREFLPWALRIAYFEVLRFRKKQTRDRLVFSEELVELLAEDAREAPTKEASRLALDTCLAKLDAPAREVLMARYDQDESIADLATRRKVSVHRLYRLLENTRSAIVTCVRRHLYLDDHPVSSQTP